MIRFVKLDDRASISKATRESAGYDLVATSMEVTRECVTYGFGLALEIPAGMYGDLRARSSISKQGPWCVPYGAGIIDSDYRGEIKLKFKPVDADIDCRSWQPYKIGERAAQIMFIKHQDTEIVEVSKLNPSARKGGFGSTGE